jgi:hypothetical protein
VSGRPSPSASIADVSTLDDDALLFALTLSVVEALTSTVLMNV